MKHALAILIALTLAGCTSEGAEPGNRLAIGFDGLRADVDAVVPLQDCRFAEEQGDAAPCTAHLQLQAWSLASGTPVDIEEFSFGSCLARIGGIPEASGCQAGATAYWSLSVNGVDSSVGLAHPLSRQDQVAWTLVPLPAQPTTLTLTLQPVSPTRNVTVTVTGTLSAPARLSFTLHEGANVTELAPLDADMAWQVEIPLEPGQSILNVTADDGISTARHQVALVRLAKGTMQVDFKGVPGHAARNDTVWFDPDSHPSASYYEGQAVAHPDYANAHDLMVAWTQQTGVEVVYKPHASFGQQVMQIDGVGDPTMNSSVFWCFEVNGALASFGVTQQPFRHGDVLSWHLGAC